MPTSAFSPFLDGLFPLSAAAMILVTSRLRGRQPRIMKLCWLLFFAGLICVGFSTVVLLAGIIPGFAPDEMITAVLSIACNSSLFAAIAGYSAAQTSFLWGIKPSKFALVLGAAVTVILIALQLADASAIARPGLPPDAAFWFGRALAFCYLVAGSLFVIAGFAYVSWNFRKEKAAFTYATLMSAGVGFLMETWILRRILLTWVPSLDNDIVTFLSMTAVIACIMYQTSLALSPGMVFDAATGRSVPLATVRIFANDIGKLIETKITAKDGRYGLMLEAGNYFITVSAPGYVFPSKTKDAYQRGVVIVTKPTVLALDIPIDKIPIGQK